MKKWIETIWQEIAARLETWGEEIRSASRAELNTAVSDVKKFTSEEVTKLSNELADLKAKFASLENAFNNLPKGN
jgi:hypothetical protein